MASIFQPQSHLVLATVILTVVLVTLSTSVGIIDAQEQVSGPIGSDLATMTDKMDDHSEMGNVTEKVICETRCSMTYTCSRGCTCDRRKQRCVAIQQDSQM